MAIWAYNYRLKREVWLLESDEYDRIRPHLSGMLQKIKDYRLEHSASLSEAYSKVPAGQTALKIYYELTGETLENFGALYQIGASGFGRFCPKCDKPFRTPRAKLCAECGFHLPEGEVAGPLARR